MSALRVLIVGGDEGLSDRLRDWFSPDELEVVASAEWNDELGATVDPSLIFITVDLPDKAGFALCGRARALSHGVPIVLVTATLARAEMDLHQRTGSGAHAWLDARTLTREEVVVTLDALIGPALGHAGEGGPEEELPGRMAEMEEELRRLHWELDETRLAARSAPFSRDFLRLSGVVSSKEKEVVRLKKEIWARDHKIAISQRTLREASARALMATRERDAATGHAAQLQRDLEAEQDEVRRLRLDVQRQGADAEEAVASLLEERQKHEETRRQHEITLAAHGEVLKEVREQAVGAAAAEWKGKLRALRRRRAHALAMLHDRIRELEAAHRKERAASLAEAERRREEELAAARAAADRQREEQQQLHELSMEEALGAHADAESRAEQHRAAHRALQARLQEERAEAVAAAAAQWERRLEDLRGAHADSVRALRAHFQDQLGGAQAGQEQERARREGESAAALQRSREELAAAREQAARLEVETRQRYELELAQAEGRHLGALTALEARLGEEKDRALAAGASEWERKLEDLRRAHAGSVDELRRRHLEQLGSLQASGAQELARREGEHDIALRRLQATHLEALTAIEARLRDERDKALAATVAAWEGQLEAAHRQHFASLEALRREQRDQIDWLQASHERAAAERNAAQQVALGRAAEQRAELVRLHELALAEARDGRLEAERRAEEDRRAASGALEERLREEQARAVAAVAALWAGKLEELRSGHAGSLEALQRRFQDQLAELRDSAARELGERERARREAVRGAAEELASARTEAAQLDQETRQRYERELARVEARHLEALGAQETRLLGERDEAVAAAGAAWQGKLQDLRSAHDASLDALRQAHQDQLSALRAARDVELRQREDEHEGALRRLGEELAIARSKAAQPGPAQLVARHAEAMKALEARLTEEKDQALAVAVAEWKAKMERLRRGHADAMAALRREHEDQLLALDAARQEGLAAHPPADPAAKVVPLKAVTRDRSG